MKEETVESIQAQIDERIDINRSDYLERLISILVCSGKLTICVKKEKLSEEERSKKLMNNAIKKLVQEAKRKACNLHIDEAVRIVTKATGTCTDEARINHEAEWEGCRLRCGAGAGTNYTSVQMPDGTVLYQAKDKGETIEIFHFGPWVERLKKVADELFVIEKEETERIKKEKNEKIRIAFSEVTF